MWWRLALLAVVSAAILIVLLMPMGTMTIHVDLPPTASGAPKPASDAALDQGVTSAGFAIGGVLFVLYVALMAWIGRWIVRRYGPQR